ncbi:MAG: hydroxymethylglutaryl-CoA lyase, partial [Oscillibacter sp.]
MVQFGLNLGCKEVMVADTVGMANPKRVNDLMSVLVERFGADTFVMHLHDTRGLALANTLTAMQLGVHKFESAAGGLGGCPFAPGAAGNVATEDVLNMLSEMGVSTGINNDRLHEAVLLVQEGVHANLVSHMTPLYKAPACV